MSLLLIWLCGTSFGAPTATIGVSIGTLAPLDSENNKLFGFGFSAGLDGELLLHKGFGVDLALGYDLATGTDGGPAGSLFYGALGPRLHLDAFIETPVDAFVDAHLDLLRSGGVGSWGWDVGAGVELKVGDYLQIGPNLRLRQAFDPLQKHATLIEIGVALRVALPGRKTESEPPPEPAPSPDIDGDGIPNNLDTCPESHMGARPDPNRAGCPALDSDADGVIDAEDVCPMQPAGANPNPSYKGCPTLDFDGDGVPDEQDMCPDTPAGANPDPARPGCTTGDSDGDGVTDDTDLCPAVHHGITPDPAQPGCPAADADQDFVPDSVDACPDQAGSPHPDPARNGCHGLVQISADRIDISTPIYFNTNEASIALDRSEPVLEAIKDAIVSLDIRGISINGYTDNQGSESYNLELSQRRAQAVGQWLIDNGVEANTLRINGFGESHPLDTNDTEAGRARNRRVEFKINDARFERQATPPSTGGN